MLKLFQMIIEWRRWGFINPMDEVKFRWSDLHLSIVQDYYSSFSRAWDLGELHFTVSFLYNLGSAWPESSRMCAKIAASFTQGLQQTLFMVPRLDKFHQSNNRINKYQVVEAFISFLLELLYHKTDSSIYLCDNQIENLEKELRLLLAILGDTSFVMFDEHKEFQKLLAEFETVANEAGGLVYSLFFSTDPACRKMDEGIDVVLNHIGLLKANIMKFLNLLPSVSISAYTSPKTSVVDTLLIVDSLIHDLDDLMKREDNWAVDVKDQINILYQWLMLCQSSVKDIGPQQPSQIRELKAPLMRIGDVAHEAEYLINSFLVGDAPLWYLVNRLTNINNKIEVVGTELQEITKKLKFGDLKVANYFNTQLSLQAKRNTDVDDVTVGFEGKTTDILRQLVGGTERLQVISIFGMAGLGKTTFAKKLYDHPSVNYWFDRLLWCVVTQIYEREIVLTNILSHLDSKPDKDRILEMDEESLAECIYRTLKGRRYLIVIDDIWDYNVWNDLQRCFPNDGNGSRILLTSRNQDLAPPKSIIYALPSLSNDQSWELLEKKVFGRGSCPPELQGIGKKIAANCCGLPLAVIVIAGILSTMDKERITWEEVGENLASYVLASRDNSVKQILELSYEHLPDHLKPCFLYFGGVREDKEICVRKLMRLWIGEGFIRKEEKKSPENVAEEYLMELIAKSLVIVAKRRSDGGVQTCTVHDLLRELCLKRSEEDNFLRSVKSDIHSIFEKGHRLVAPEYCTSRSCCQTVRSFRGYNRASRLYVRDMTSLRVLDFYYAPSRCIGIECLVNLKYLVVSDVPATIGRLISLEYLHVTTHMWVCLPSAIMKMKKLRYINVSSGLAAYDGYCSSSEKNNLEFLSTIKIERSNDEEMLKHSPRLRRLKCNWFPSPLGEYQHFCLSFLAQLESLKIIFTSTETQEVSFPSNIKKLTLCGRRLSREGMSIIGRLENLEVLKLENCDFVGERWDTEDGEFQKLTFLKLDGISLTQWIVASRQHFPKLQQLFLFFCKYLQEIPSEIGEITALQLIEVQGQCPKSLVESAEGIQREQLDWGNEELRVVISAIDHT